MSSTPSRAPAALSPQAFVAEQRRDWRTATVVVAGLWAIFALPWLTGRVTIPYDAKALFQAQLQFLASALHSGQSPAWNPHTFVGVPQIADPQSFIFSPALLLATLSSSPSFWLLDAYVFLLLGIGALSVLMLFRDQGWHPGGGAVAAICFAFGGSASWRMQHVGQIQSYAFFALTLWLLVRARGRGSVAWGAAAGLGAGLMLAEPDQVALLACYLLVIVVLVDWLRAPAPLQSARGDLLPLAAAAGVALLVAALPLTLTYLFVAGSNRPVIAFAEAARGSLNPASLLTLLVPDLYGIRDALHGYWGPYSETWDPRELTLSPNMSQLYMGALPCLLLIRGALSRGALRRPEIMGYTLAAVAALIYALGSSTPFFRLIFGLLPGVDLFRRPADGTFLLGGFLAVISGYVVHLWLSCELATQRWPLRLEWLVVTVLLGAGAVLAARHGRLASALVPLAGALAMVLAAAALLAIPRGRLLAAGRLVAFLPAVMVGADLVLGNGPSESTGKPVDRSADALKSDTHNETIAFLSKYVRRKDGSAWRDRIEMAGVGFNWQNAAEAHGFDQTLGYNPLRTALVTDALGAGDYIAGPEQRTFSPLFPSYRCRLADLLGLRFIASPVPIGRLDRRLGNEDLNLLARTPDAYLYENPRALPRVIFAEQAMPADFDRILADGSWPEFDPRKTVLLDAAATPDVTVTLRPAPRTPAAEQQSASLEAAAMSDLPREAETVIVRYENTRIEVAVDAPRPGYLVLGDVWHPWWAATVDGRASLIRRANVLFRAVAVPAGRHRVRFEFEPLAGAFADLSRRLLPRRR